MTFITERITDVGAGESDRREGLLGRIGRAVVRSLRYSRIRNALASLPDHTLRDIGLGRSDIDSLAHSMAEGRWDDTRTRRESAGDRG